MPASHRFEDHLGELRVMLRAENLSELFAEAGRALGELFLEGSAPPTSDWERCVVRAADRETLLAAWLNELIYLSETRRVVYTEFRVDSVGETEVLASARGVPTERVRTAVKAATFHELFIREVDGGFEGHVVLDV
jgi:SHS2 domain-containing protein